MFHNVVKKAFMLSVAATLVVTPVVTSAQTGIYSRSASGTSTGAGTGTGVETGTGDDSMSDNSTETESPKSSGSSKKSGGGSGSGSVSKESTAIGQMKMADGTVSTVPGRNTSKTVKSFAAITPAPWANAVVTVADSNYGPAAKASLDSAAQALGVEIGPVLDIVLGTLQNGRIEAVTGNTALIGFRLQAPADFTVKPGYELAVIHISAGGAVEVLPNWSSETGILQFYTTSSGVFALTQVPAGTLDNVKVAQYNQANS